MCRVKGITIIATNDRRPDSASTAAMELVPTPTAAMEDSTAVTALARMFDTDAPCVN